MHLDDAHNDYLVLELSSNGTLAQVLKRRTRLTEPEVCYYTQQTVAALVYLEAQGIVHGDVKLSNLLLSRHMRVRLGDFGLAAPAGVSGKICGTTNYTAPEVLKGRVRVHHIVPPPPPPKPRQPPVSHPRVPVSQLFWRA